MKIKENFMSKTASDIARWFIENNVFLKCDQSGSEESYKKLEGLIYYSNVISNLLNGKDIIAEEFVAYKNN
jgi:uncharacterized phage-associated protein